MGGEGRLPSRIPSRNSSPATRVAAAALGAGSSQRTVRCLGPSPPSLTAPISGGGTSARRPAPAPCHGPAGRGCGSRRPRSRGISAKRSGGVQSMYSTRKPLLSAPATWSDSSCTTWGETSELVGGGEVADLERLAEAVGAADVGHEVARGAPLEELAELEARVVVLAGGHRDAGSRGRPPRRRRGRRRAPAPRTRRDRGPRAAAAWRRLPEHVELLVDVDHDADAVAERLPHRLDALAGSPAGRGGGSSSCSSGSPSAAYAPPRSTRSSTR